MGQRIGKEELVVNESRVYFLDFTIGEKSRLRLNTRNS